jgi:CubicO group peptidase (beta-lactamase class C family)
MKFCSTRLSALLVCAAFMASLLLGGAGCATPPKHVFPGANWEYNQAGLPPEVVREVDVFVRTLDTTSLMVVKDGRVVYEYGNVAEPCYLASARKSVLSMLYGPYVANGTIRLDATLKDLGMSDVGGLLPIEERAKVMDLITARSGVYHPASNDGDLLEFAPKRGSQEPGSYWLYSNWDFNAAGAAFERMTGRNIYDALRDDLAIPIGMQDFNRERQKKDEKPERSQYPAYPMWLSARDMARLGYLMLRQGRWQDRRLIPAEWVRRSTKVVTPLAEMHPETMQSGPFGYGYMWWVWDGPFASGPYHGAYTASGAHGQWISVLPALDMVVVHVASWSSTGPRHSVDKPDYYRLLDLLTGKRPASEAELRQWKEAAASRATAGSGDMAR